MPPHPRRWQILAVLCLSLFVVVLDNTILNVAVPSLLRDLDASTSDVQWVIDAYALVFAGLVLTAGSLGDRHGRRRAMLIGFALFGLGSLLAAFATGPGWLIAMRALMGVGSAFLLPGTMSILAQVFPEEERAKAFAIWGTASMLAMAAGPLAGGLLLEHFWWGSVFLVNVPVAGLAVVGLVALVPESRGPRRRPDVLGAVLSTAGMSALVWAIISGPFLGALAVAVPALVGFVLWQQRNPEPMLNLGLFRERNFTGAAATIALLAFAMAGTLFAFTQYLQLVFGYGPLKAGLALLPVAVSAGVGNGVGVSFDARLGARNALGIGFLIIAAGFVLIAMVEGYALLAVGLVVLGFGAGMGAPAAYNTLMGTIPREEAGVGSAVNDAGTEVGNAFGVAVIGSVISAVYAAGLPDEVTGPARRSLGEALTVGDPGVAMAAKEAFTDAMAVGALAGAVASLAASFVAFAVIRERDRERDLVLRRSTGDI